MPERFLVDSSVWIDFLNGTENASTSYLAGALQNGVPRVLLGDLVAMEVLRGIRDDARYARIRLALAAFASVNIVVSGTAYRAAQNYRALRSRGFTIRSSIDCLIATYCIDERIPLLHSDRDFGPFAEHLGLEAVTV